MRRTLILLAALALPGAAAAADLVALRERPTSFGPLITLGDVFDGVGAPAASVVVARAAPAGLDAILDAGEIQLAARRAGLEWPNASGAHRIVVFSQPGAARPAESGAAAGARGRRRSVLVYARDIAAGEVIGARDLRWSSDAVKGPDAVEDPDRAIGKSARRPLREGDASALHDLTAPLLVKRDELVNVIFESDGINLTLQGKALGDASRGQAVQVVNTQSKKVIDAVCSGPGQAAVGPLAEALKAAAASDPQRIASLQ